MLTLSRTNNTKRRKEWQAIALVRKNLGWLPGTLLPSPTNETRWISFDAGRNVKPRYFSLTPDLLSQAQVAVRRLRAPEALRYLKRICSDPGDWLNRIELLLRELPSACPASQLASPPELASALGQRWQEEFNQLWEQHRVCRPLLRSVAYLHLSLPNLPCRQWLSRLKAILPRLAKLTPQSEAGRIALMICILAPDLNESWLDFLLQFFSLPIEVSKRLWNHCQRTQQQNKALFRAMGRTPRSHDAIAFNSLSQAVVFHLDWMLFSSPEVRQRVSRLLGSLVGKAVRDMQTLFQRQTEKQHELQSEIRRCRSMGQPNYMAFKGAKVYLNICKVDSGMHATMNGLSQLQKCMEVCATLGGSKQWVHSLSLFFEQLPVSDWKSRVGLFTCWHFHAHCRERLGEQSRALADTLRRLVPILKKQRETWVSEPRGASEKRVAWWRMLVGALASASYSKQEWERIQKLLVHTSGSSHGAAKLPEASSIGPIAAASPTYEFAKALHAILRPARQADAGLRGEIQIAIRFGQSLRSSRLVSRYADVSLPRLTGDMLAVMQDDKLANSLETIAGATKDGTLIGLASYLALNGKSKALTNLASRIQGIARLNKSLPPLTASPNKPQRIPTWFEEIPGELQASLCNLLRYHPSPEKTARRILAKELPDSKKIEKEILGIRERLQFQVTEEKRQILELRLEKLVARLASANQFREGISARRLANVADKIDARVLQAIQDNVDELCRQFMLDALGLTQEPPQTYERLFREPYEQLAWSVLELKGKSRKVGLGLLRRASQDKKNEMPLEPENQAFLEHMQARGINMRAWLDATTSKQVTIGGKQATMGFSTDALELLLMGYHFGTCLSPGGFNFFSAVTNSIDVNKQVLFCRQNNGRVLGRCLFALNSEGRILTFNRYSHGEPQEFERLVDEFAIRLANAMNTTLDSQGHVQTLVARKWYNDGPTKGGLYAVEDRSSKSPMRKLLRMAPTEALMPRLMQLVGTRENLKANLSPVLDQPVFEQRADFVQLLALEFGGDENVAMVAKLKLALLCFQSQQMSLALKIMAGIRHRQLAERIQKALQRSYRGILSDKNEPLIIDLLIEFDCRIARRYLDITRDDGIKSPFDESCPDRRAALARIHARLGQATLAERFRRPSHAEIETAKA